MVRYVLTVSARLLEGMAVLRPQGEAGYPNIPFFVKMKCITCGEEGNVCMHLEKTVCLKHKVCPSRKKCFPTPSNTGHMLRKCRLCGVMSSISMVEGFGLPLRPLMEKAPVMLFDCQGCELISFTSSVGWEVITTDGTRLYIDMSSERSKDEDAVGQTVAATDVKFSFEITK